MYVIGDGTDKPYRLKVRSPIFVTVSAVPTMLIGYKIADVPAIMGSVDMCLGETDR
jgi:NADH-quinone oxidoreductase subunit D